MQHTNAGVAQSVEQLIRNQQVAGSSPATSSKTPKPYGFGVFCSVVICTYLEKGLRMPADRADCGRAVSGRLIPAVAALP